MTTYPLLSNSKLSHILEECPALRDCQLSEGEFTQYKGRKYAWINIDKDGAVKLLQNTLDVLELQSGMELLQHFFDTHILSSLFLTCIFPVERFSC